MKLIRILRAVCVFTLCISTVTVTAKEVVLNHEGLTLTADFTLAAGRKPADGVILITHGSLAHRDMEAMVYLRKLLKDRGYNILAINLSLGIDNRHGMYDCKLPHRHQNDDAVSEIAAWVGWLKNQGVKDIVLLGHSRGGAQTALYAAEKSTDLIRAVILMAPATRDNTSAQAYKMRYGQLLAPVLNQAKKLVRSGKGNEVLKNANLMTCRDTPVTAGSFVSYYGQDPRLDTPYLLHKITLPTLVLVAGGDRVVIGLDTKLEFLKQKTNIRMKVIEGSDHLFRDLNTDDAVDAIAGFLDGI